MIFASGGLAKSSDDLCDASTFGETSNPLRRFVVGCTETDPQLVNIQLKLVDKIAPGGLDAQNETTLLQANDGHETYLQFLTGGGVARTRPSDKAQLSPLRPAEKRTFSYSIPLGSARAGTFSARLLFRNLPPYWVRAMAKEQPATEKPRLEPLIENIQTVVMVEKSGSFAR